MRWLAIFIIFSYTFLNAKATYDKSLVVEVEEGFRGNIINQTGDKNVLSTLNAMFPNDQVFRHLYPKDKIAAIYTKSSNKADIKAVMVRHRKKDFFAYKDKNGKIYHSIYKDISFVDRFKKFYTNIAGKKKSSTVFSLPVRHPRITSPFTKKRWHPILHRYRPHHGVDFGARIGTPVKAIGAGKVIYAGWMGGYGRVVKIDHGGGYVSLYAHLSRILVRKGQKARRGRLIGRIGNTGRSTGPHLHLGLYINKKPVDPMKYMGKKITTSAKKDHKRILIKEAKVLKRRLQQMINRGVHG